MDVTVLTGRLEGAVLMAFVLGTIDLLIFDRSVEAFRSDNKLTAVTFGLYGINMARAIMMENEFADKKALSVAVFFHFSLASILLITGPNILEKNELSAEMNKKEPHLPPDLVAEKKRGKKKPF